MLTVEIRDYPSPDCGMGVTFNHVAWQMLQNPGCRYWVNIDKPTSPYRELSHGPNPWDYYFVQERPPMAPVPLQAPINLALSGHNAWTLRHQQIIHARVAHEFWLQPELRAEVDSFRRRFFKGRVLGVHLRGTDKATEYSPVPRSETVSEIERLLSILEPDTIFLATDDADYHAILQRFSPVSLAIPRSDKSLHHHAPNGPYMSGRWALMDAWLLAACDWLAFTPSNFATIPLIMGRHIAIYRLNSHCEITPFHPVVEQLFGIT